jgi:hypothetical protein
MKKLIFTLALSALVAVPWPTFAVVPPPAFGYLGSVKAGAGPTTTTTTAADTTGADLIIIACSSYSPNAVPNESDNQSNTYTDLTEYTDTTGGIRLHYKVNPTTNASHTFTCSATNSFPATLVAWFSGSYTAGDPFGQQNGAGFNSGSSSPQSVGSITPSEDNMLVVSAVSWDAGATSAYTTSTGGLTVAQNQAKSGNAEGGALAYVIQTTAAAINPSWSWSGGTSNLAGTVASFKSAGAASSFIPGIINAPVRGGGRRR